MNKEKISHISTLLPFSALSTEKTEHLLRVANLFEYPKGKTLYLAGEKASSIYVILSGWIKLYRETLDGNQAIVDVLSKGHIFGEGALFNENCYTCSAEVAEHAEVATVPLSFFAEEIETNTKFSNAILKIMAKENCEKTKELEHHSIQTAPQRIGCFLLRLTDVTQTGPVQLNLPYDKSLLAMRLGMQPETFSRSLNKLKEETGITIKGSTVEMKSLHQLSDFCCMSCTAEFPCRDLIKCKMESQAKSKHRNA